MQLHQHRTDGQIDATELSTRDMAAAKLTALSLVARPAVSGVYRIRFVDAEYDRTVFDTYNVAPELAVGTLVFAGAS